MCRHGVGAYSSTSRVARSVLVVLVAVGLLVPLAALAHLPGITQRVSVSSEGTQADNFSSLADISADGRFVAFWSLATNLVPGDTNNIDDVFVHDRQTGTTERVSLNSAGEQGTGGRQGAFFPALSDDGRFVAFAAQFGNLAPGDTNNELDIFVRDRQTGTTERVSVSSAEEEGTGGFSTGRPDISADGRFVAFDSDFVNLVPGDTNEDSDVFVRDRQTGTTVRASVASDGTEAGFEEASLFPVLSADGQVVAFQSEASFVLDDTCCEDIYVHDERPSADLSVTKSDSPDPVIRGRELTYTIVVTNSGSSANMASLTDFLPASVRFVSATSTSGSCAEAGGIVTCDLGTLGSGANSTVTIVVKPRTLGIISNTVRVGSLQPDPNRADNTDTEETTVVSR